MNIDRLEDRIDVVRAQIMHGHYTIAAKEAAGLIELAFREFYRRSLGTLDGASRRRVFEVEAEMGGGTRTVEEFTLGQLVGLFRASNFLDRWSEASGQSIRGLRVINIDQLVHVRNAVVHEQYEVDRGEAELFFGCLQTILETFGILSLEQAFAASATSATPVADPPEVERRPQPERASRSRPSVYSWRSAGEQQRLKMQAASSEQFDLELIARARARWDAKDALTALDLGCADGEVTRTRLVDPGAFSHVLGVDRDAEAIEQAGAVPDPRVDYAVVDADDLDVSTGLESWLEQRGQTGFDLVFSALTLHHMASPIRVLRSMRYLLRPGGAIVLRGFDDASMMQFPDREDRLRRVVELTLLQPGVSDRHNGRRLYHWLFRAGFRDIELHASLRTTAGMDADQRHRLFVESFEFRRRYFVGADDGDAPAERRAQREEFDELVAELELDFEDESSAFCELDLGAVAWLP